MRCILFDSSSLLAYLALMDEVGQKTRGEGLGVDVLGLFLSGLCIVHCLLTPIFLLVIPNLVPHWLQAEGHGHGWFYLILVGLASFSMVVGYRKHTQWRPILWLALGLVVVGLGLLV